MNKKTFSRRYDTLLRDVSIHPHKDELLNIMYQQVQDDFAEVKIPSIINNESYS
tara:strand:- start:7279 stop:7440 length:162 start_codon:yes stop_codon:yes gene_type:complete